MISVKENKDESVEITDNNVTVKYTPNVDLNLAKQLLLEFNSIKDSNNQHIFELWKINDYYFLPAIQEMLFWNYFVHIVKHKKARKYLVNKKYIFDKQNYATISGLYRIKSFLFYKEKRSRISKFIFNILTAISRKLSNINDYIIASDDFSGHRYKNLKDTFSKFANYSEVKHIDSENLFGDKKSLYTGYKKLFYTKSNNINISYDSASRLLKEYIPENEFYTLIESIDFRVQEYIEEYKILLRYLENKKIKKIISYDQLEQHLALLLVSKKLNIKYYSYQHGAISKHHPGWLADGIDKKYCNLVADKIYVWGEYWKNKLVKYSNKYSNENIEVGTNLRGNIHSKYPFKLLNKNKLSILFPYEFLADNLKLSTYIEHLIGMNINVIIKLRPKDFGSGDINSDLYAYSEKVRDNIIFKYNLTEDEIVSNIDIIGCSQSTYAYEMMQYNKPIWYFETNFTMLEDIVEDGIAYSIDDNKIKNFKQNGIDENYLIPKYDDRYIEKVFSTQKYYDVISSLINNKLQ